MVQEKIEEPRPSWEDRNDALKIFKASGKFGWMHLVVGQNKITKRKFLRLKRYMNWFSIPDAKHLLLVQKMLQKGAEELKWKDAKGQNIKITEDIETTNPDSDDAVSNFNIPDEVINFIEDHPDFTKKVLQLSIQTSDPAYFQDLLAIIDEAVAKSGERFKGAFKEIVKKISKEKAKDIRELGDLMEQWNLYQISSLTNILKTRLDTIQTFEELILDPKTYEINTDNSIHRILEKNMWLIDENYWIVQSNKSLRTFVGDEILKNDKKHSKKRPDFACVNPSEDSLIIIEIKRPSLELKKKELDQAEQYHLICNRYKGKKYKKIQVYLVGNTVSTEARDLVELRKGLEILTYTELLQACKKRYQEYLKVLGKD